MNLISIIKESEKLLRELLPQIYIGYDGDEVDYEFREKLYKKITVHNRQTILKLVEGIEKWANDNKVRCEECENKEIHDIDPVNKKLDDLLLLLTDLKNKLKQWKKLK